MSVTNPNRVVTKQDLADFYGDILPYLGGMPEVLANKFSKGDMYSTDEKMIGQWIDKKPLYQKTITGINATINYDNTWVVIANIPNIERTVGISVWYGATLASAKEVEILSNGNVQILSSCVGRTLTGATLQYTKSTDSAISIGSDTDYSTTEKIVGTWIDNKPIWQKTINFGTLPNTSDKEVLHNIQNIDAITNLYCILINPTTGYSLVAGYCGVNTNHSSDTGLGADRSMVKIKTYDDRSAYTGYVTLQYTKTSS